MTDTLTENLINDVATAVQVKLAALDNSISACEKTAVDWRALATQAKDAITSPEMGNILRQANKRGVQAGTALGALNLVGSGINGAIRGYRGADPGVWNKIKGTVGGSLKGQLAGAARGFGTGYAAGAGGSVITDAIGETPDMQALKDLFNGVKSPSKQELNTLNSMLNDSVM